MVLRCLSGHRAAVPAGTVPEVGAGPPPGPAKGRVPGLAAGGSSSETHGGQVRAAPTAEVGGRVGVTLTPRKAGRVLRGREVGLPLQL